MKTKSQKQVIIKNSVAQTEKSRTLLFTNFHGTPTKEINKLKTKLRSLDSVYQVGKKRLLRVAFQERGIANLDPEKFKEQLAVIYSPQDLLAVAGPVFKFSKDHRETFSIVGGYDLGENKEFALDYIIQIAALPSREILLGQLVGLIAAPLKMIMLALKERALKLETAS